MTRLDALFVPNNILDCHIPDRNHLSNCHIPDKIEIQTAIFRMGCMKYKDRDTDNGLLSPRKSNQKMNKCLKKIASRLGITREVNITEYCGNERTDITTKICDIIATHTAKRTFVVHCAECGWTEEQIRAYTGHEDFKALRSYFTIGSKKRQLLMENTVHLFD